MSFGLWFRKWSLLSVLTFTSCLIGKLIRTSVFLLYDTNNRVNNILKTLSYTVWSVVKWKALLFGFLTEQTLMALENTLASDIAPPHIRKMRRAFSNIKLFVAM